jgi:hypothetical protein
VSWKTAQDSFADAVAETFVQSFDQLAPWAAPSGCASARAPPTLPRMTTRRRWTEETIEAELRPIVAQLGRFPTRSELAARGLSGLYAALARTGGASAWRERLNGNGSRPVGHDDIARRAYFLSQANGSDPLANWLQAERELRAA